VYPPDAIKFITRSSLVSNEIVFERRMAEISKRIRSANKNFDSPKKRENITTNVDFIFITFLN
jgi:hypothetical protein